MHYIQLKKAFELTKQDIEKFQVGILEKELGIENVIGLINT